MGMGRGASGLPFFPAIFKTENQQVAALTGVICAAGTLYYIAFNLSGAPRTSPPFPLCAERAAPAERAPSRPGAPQLPPPLLPRESRLPPPCSAVAHKLPSTFSPQWLMATAAYRAATNQDPITNASK